MSESKRFPILPNQHKMWATMVGTSLPWDVIEPLRESLERFHDQTLEVLARRGGLAVAEIGRAYIETEARKQGYVEQRGGGWAAR